MARKPTGRPTRAQAAAARAAALAAPDDSLPIRFVADYDHVTLATTTAYKAGMILSPPPKHRKAALKKGKAVVHGQ